MRDLSLVLRDVLFYIPETYEYRKTIEEKFTIILADLETIPDELASFAWDRARHTLYTYLPYVDPIEEWVQFARKTFTGKYKIDL